MPVVEVRCWIACLRRETPPAKESSVIPATRSQEPWDSGTIWGKVGGWRKSTKHSKSPIPWPWNDQCLRLATSIVSKQKAMIGMIKENSLWSANTMWCLNERGACIYWSTTDRKTLETVWSFFDSIFSHIITLQTKIIHWMHPSFFKLMQRNMNHYPYVTE